MNYSNNPAHVQVDRFTNDGRLKWKYTDQLDMTDLYDAGSIHHCVMTAIRRKFGKVSKNFIFVVLEPYHVHSHPVMIRGQDD